MSTDPVAQWTDEEVARQFRLEVQQRFAAENEAYLRQERQEIAAIKAKLDAEGSPHPEWFAERDSFLWEIYSDSEIQIEHNVVMVIVPRGFAIYTDFVEMFADTSVGWTVPSVGAEIIAGVAHAVIKLILIDYWDDTRHAAWLAEEEQIRDDAARRVKEHDALSEVYGVAAGLRTFPVSFEDHLRLVDAVDVCRQVLHDLDVKES